MGWEDQIRIGGDAQHLSAAAVFSAYLGNQPVYILHDAQRPRTPFIILDELHPA